jgi:hypothetical protein
MNTRRSWIVVGLVAVLTGWLHFAYGSPTAEPQALPASPGTYVSPATRSAPWARMAQFPAGGQVTVTPGGVWLTYTEDGEGNPITPREFALDITTGDMWFMSGGQAVEVSHDGEWTTYRADDFGYGPPRDFGAVAVDEAGYTWLTMCVPYLWSDPETDGGLIAIGPDGSWTDYTHLFDMCFYEAVADRTGNKWLTERDNFVRFDGLTWDTYFSEFTGSVIEQHYAEIVTTIDRGYRRWYVEVPDRVWSFNWLIGRGVNVYDGSQWTKYTPEDGLAHEVVTSMGADHSGHKWFSTAGGVSMLDDNGTLDKGDDVWTTFDLNGLDIAVDAAGNVWVTITDSVTYEWLGVAVWDGANWTIYDTANSGLPHNRIYDIFVDDMDIKWFGTYGGLAVLINLPYRSFLPLITR